MLHPGVLVLALAALPFQEEVPSARARRIAAYAHDQYSQPALETLAELVAFDTYQRPGVPNAEHPSFRDMTAYLKRKAEEFGLDFADHGAVVVIGLGTGEKRLGVVTHADVQPADPEKWAADPFTLDLDSEPGRLVGRGVEDDKGPIVCALYAMKAIAEKRLPLGRRIELIISYTEESDWAPFQSFLAEHPPPELNVAIDAQYPVVVAEKGWCSVSVRIPRQPAEPTSREPWLESFSGGFFLAQVPEDAEAVVLRPDAELVARLRAAADADTEVRYEFFGEGGERLGVRARGTSTHSSRPEEGRNAITHLAELLAQHPWPDNAPARMVRFIDDLVGTGHYGERFGDLAYEHEFMGPLTLSFGTLKEEEQHLVGGINLRRPAGRTTEEVRASIQTAIEGWASYRGYRGIEHTAYIGAPHLPEAPAHVPVLLDTFRHYTGRKEAEVISIGGGTHARLVPNGVNFGPAMPDVPYTGHSEHEYMSRRQFQLNLRMYTSFLVDLAGE